MFYFCDLENRTKRRIYHGFNQEYTELSDKHNNLTKSGISELLTTTVPLKTRNKPERLFTVNVISSGDPMEIFTDKEGEIVLKKYSPLGELAECAKEYSESLARTTGNVVCISDREQIIAMSGTVKKELVEKPVSDKLEQIMHDRENFMSDDDKRNYINISDEIENEYNSQIISPIICHGDVLGAVIMLSKDGKKKFGEQEKQMVMVASDFLGHHMES